MHDITKIRIATQYIGDYLAECLWEYSFVNVLYCIVNIFFGGTYTAHHITVGVHNIFFFLYKLVIIPKIPTCKGL